MHKSPSAQEDIAAREAAQYESYMYEVYLRRGYPAPEAKRKAAEDRATQLEVRARELEELRQKKTLKA